MQKEIVQYLKNKKGHKLGVLVGMKGEDNIVRVGYSAYAQAREWTPFDKEKGLAIARGRAVSPRLDKPTNIQDLPFSVQTNIEAFLIRCDRYFYKNERTASLFVDMESTNE